MKKPIITFSKEIISKGDEYLRCVLCSYGKKAGIILWRVEFKTYYYKKSFMVFHWTLCNRCRYLLFVAMGGKKINKITMDVLGEPKQRVSNKGKIIPSKQYSKGKK